MDFARTGKDSNPRRPNHRFACLKESMNQDVERRSAALPRAWLNELMREIDPIFRDVRARRTVLQPRVCRS